MANCAACIVISQWGTGTLQYLQFHRVQERKSIHQKSKWRLMSCHREAEHYLCMGDHVFLIGGFSLATLSAYNDTMRLRPRFAKSMLLCNKVDVFILFRK